MDFAMLASLGVFLALNLAAASSGAIFRPGEWYARLAKPAWTPPNWAFPVVWSILFLMNAASGWLVWQTAGPAASGPLGLYVLSLVLNASWSAVFFGLHRMVLGFVNVSLIWLSIVAVALAFWPISPVAAALQLPYLVWVTIAAALNLTVARMNQVAARSA
ncbi:TspO/MBR family protein [Hyphomonas sp.]|uniref:TspO/MBR family protein n=1 Tax=Hyphomonas sp. TaxID=87 RepID=UPI001BD019FA|nr:TspO/MBR family protein [Hyphomonas sp.]